MVGRGAVFVGAAEAANLDFASRGDQMTDRVRMDWLGADLAAVEALLAGRTEEEDPVGWLQFSARREERLEEIRDMERADRAGVVGGRS